MILPWVGALIAVAGGVGAALRFVVDGLVRSWLGARLPWGTALINVVGSFLLGVLTGLFEHGLPPVLLPVLGTGLLGGFTTFSTASIESVRLLQQGRVAASFGYGLGVLVVSVAAAALGLALSVS